MRPPFLRLSGAGNNMPQARQVWNNLAERYAGEPRRVRGASFGSACIPAATLGLDLPGPQHDGQP